MESNRHRIAMNVLIRSINQAFANRDNFFAVCNMFVYYSSTQARNRDFKGPDFFVVLDVDGTRERQCWVVWEENGRYPNVIVELMSPSTAEADTGVKKNIYEQIFRTPDYYVFNPFDPDSLQGWHLDANQMTEFEVPPPELQALLYPNEQVRPAWGIPSYWVTDKGRIFSCKRKKPHKMSTYYDGRGSERDNKDKGYERVGLSTEQFAVHILVWEAFNGRRPEGMQVCHNDGDNRHNTLLNLRLDTRKNNCADRRKHGTENLGEKCGTSKLSNEQALEIYQRARSGQEKLVDIAKEFGVRPNTVSAIKNGQNWSSITNHKNMC